MQLNDGITYYKEWNPSYWHSTILIEIFSSEVCKSIKKYLDEPFPKAALYHAKCLLGSIEKWKSLYDPKANYYSDHNSQELIWSAFQKAINSEDEKGSLDAIMNLRGFGGSTGRAKKATAVMRFLAPESWGVVDWRTIAILNFLDVNKWDIDETIKEAKKLNPNVLREKYDIVNSEQAVNINKRYNEIKSMSFLIRAADVDMALFGLSLKAWRLP